MKNIFLFLILVCFSLNTSFAQTDSLSQFMQIEKSLADSSITYTTLSERLHLTWEVEGQAQDFNASVRTTRDSIIWMSAGIMGIEGIRTVFLPDTFHVINRLTNEYTVKPLKELEQSFYFPVNFSLLQHLISGCKFNIQPQAIYADTKDSVFLLYEENDRWLQIITVDTTSYTIQKILLKDKLIKQEMAITFAGYNYLQQKPFSYLRKVVIQRNDILATLNIEVIRAEVDIPLSYPFAVPDKFKRTD